MARKIYKLKHKPTGLYYVKTGYEHISEKGTVYSTGCNSLSSETIVHMKTDNQDLIKRHLDVFEKVGQLKIEHNRQIYNFKTSKYETVENWYVWSMDSPVGDFEKEILTTDCMSPQKPASFGNVVNMLHQNLKNCQELISLDEGIGFVIELKKQSDAISNDNSRSEQEREAATRAKVFLDQIEKWLNMLNMIKTQEHIQDLDNILKVLPK